jgi:hypothetical protein
MHSRHPLPTLPLPARLPADTRDELRRLLAEAIHRHEVRHRAAIESALAHVPALLRVSVRNLLTE